MQGESNGQLILKSWPSVSQKMLSEHMPKRSSMTFYSYEWDIELKFECETSLQISKVSSRTTGNKSTKRAFSQAGCRSPTDRDSSVLAEKFGISMYTLVSDLDFASRSSGRDTFATWTSFAKALTDHSSSTSASWNSDSVDHVRKQDNMQPDNIKNPRIAQIEQIQHTWAWSFKHTSSSSTAASDTSPSSCHANDFLVIRELPRTQNKDSSQPSERIHVNWLSRRTNLCWILVLVFGHGLFIDSLPAFGILVEYCFLLLGHRLPFFTTRLRCLDRQKRTRLANRGGCEHRNLQRIGISHDRDENHHWPQRRP